MKKTICFIVAIPVTAQAFLRDHIAALSNEYDVYLMGNIKGEQDVAMLNLAGWHHIDIERGISLWRDLKAVWQAWRYFQKMRFDAVHSVTPKAGLVSALAGKLAGIKHRTHIFTGQVWATQQGIMRGVLKFIDKIIVSCDNHILVDGKSQRSFLVKEGILREGQAQVFGKGSISGVKNVSSYPNLNELMIASDLLISDYSSIYFDYSILGRPMLCFAYDYERYNQERGLYFDIRKELESEEFDHEDSLLSELLQMDIEKRRSIALRFRDKYVEEYGNASKKSLDIIKQQL